MHVTTWGNSSRECSHASHEAVGVSEAVLNQWVCEGTCLPTAKTFGRLWSRLLASGKNRQISFFFFSFYLETLMSREEKNPRDFISSQVEVGRRWGWGRGSPCVLGQPPTQFRGPARLCFWACSSSCTLTCPRRNTACGGAPQPLCLQDLGRERPR